MLLQIDLFLFCFLFHWFQIVKNKEFVLYKKTDKDNEKRFDDANKFCKEKHLNGSLAIFTDEDSKEAIKKVIYQNSEKKGVVLK